MTQNQFILIAEDDPDLSSLLLYHLTRQGYRTLAVPDGRSAVKQAFEQPPDLLVLDLMLPELHGLGVCQILKASAWTWHVPILVVTATGADKRERTLRLGADDFLGKPFEMTEFISRVQTLLVRHQPVVNS